MIKVIMSGTKNIRKGTKCEAKETLKVRNKKKNLSEKIVAMKKRKEITMNESGKEKEMKTKIKTKMSNE